MTTPTFRPSAPASPNGSSASHGGDTPTDRTETRRRPATASLSPPGRRRRPALLALGVALAAAGGLLAATLATRAGDRVPVLAVARTVEVGSVVTAADLTEARIATDPHLSPIPASAMSAVVGKVATVPLRPGSLLTADDLTTTAVPGPGRQLIGVLLKPGQLPARPLTPWQPVLLVTTPGDQPTADSGQDAQPQAVPATVVDVGGIAQDGSVTVDVTVDATLGPALARQAATGHIALIVVPAGAGR